LGQSLINLKCKTEKEIENINKLYDKTINDLEQSFQQKHEQLLKKENDLKEQLQSEVTKIKEQLENLLSELNNEIKINDKINKGYKKLQIDNYNLEKAISEENLIRNLTYISKQNKNKKQMRKILEKKIKSIKFSYSEKESNIKYEDHYFYEFSCPENIKINNIDYNSLDVSWEREDNIQVSKLQIRKENGEFENIYEGNETNYKIKNLEINTIYEIRICNCLYNFISPWSELKKFKTCDIDSIILKKSKRVNEFINKLIEWSGYNKMELIYRGSKDGMNSKSFHQKCDNKGETITLYENDKNNIFGGYSSIPWSGGGSFKEDRSSFLFTLTNIYEINPTKFPNKNSGNQVCHNLMFGPCFGYGKDLGIFIKGGNYSKFPTSFEDILEKGNSIFTGDLNNNNTNLKLVEIEVFQLFK